MNYELEERLVCAFENIAEALKGIDETQRQQFRKRWPDPKERREAIVTRVPTAEDLIREAHGGTSDEPIRNWLDLPVEEEWIGVREQEFNRSHSDAGAEEPAGSEPSGGSPEAAESEPEPSGESAAHLGDVQER